MRNVVKGELRWILITLLVHLIVSLHEASHCILTSLSQIETTVHFPEREQWLQADQRGRVTCVLCTVIAASLIRMDQLSITNTESICSGVGYTQDIVA